MATDCDPVACPFQHVLAKILSLCSKSLNATQVPLPLYEGSLEGTLNPTTLYNPYIPSYISTLHLGKLYEAPRRYQGPLLRVPPRVPRPSLKDPRMPGCCACHPPDVRNDVLQPTGNPRGTWLSGLPHHRSDPCLIIVIMVISTANHWSFCYSHRFLR